MKFLVHTPLVMLGSVIVSQAAHAHAKLVRADPPIDAVVKTAPHRLELVFSEAISGAFSGAVLKAPGGGLAHTTVRLGNGGKSLQLMISAPMAPGIYTVEWHAVASDDGHRTSGVYKFTLR